MKDKYLYLICNSLKIKTLILLLCLNTFLFWAICLLCWNIFVILILILTVYRFKLIETRMFSFKTVSFKKTINLFSLTMRSRPCAWKLRSIRKTGFGFNVDHLIRHKASI